MPLNNMAYLRPPNSLVIKQVNNREAAPGDEEARWTVFIEYPKTSVKNFR